MKGRRPSCRARRAMSLLCTLVLFACNQTVGRDFSNTTARLVKPRVTDKATVTRYFGAPQSVMPVPDGEVWHWHFVKSPNMVWPSILGSFVPIVPEAIMYIQLERASTAGLLEVRFNGDLVASCTVSRMIIPGDEFPARSACEQL